MSGSKPIETQIAVPFETRNTQPMYDQPPHSSGSTPARIDWESTKPRTWSDQAIGACFLARQLSEVNLPQASIAHALPDGTKAVPEFLMRLCHLIELRRSLGRAPCGNRIPGEHEKVYVEQRSSSA